MKRTRDLIVAGASAGGVEALRDFVAGLPADLPAAVLVVLHLPAGGTSALASILNRAGPLRAVVARNGRPMEPGLIQVAPPDHHLLVIDDSVALSHGPTENGHRPAINTLFRSAAVARGPAVTGVLLSGALDDGVAGLVAISARGGLVMVQDPAEALYPSMPEQALRNVRADHVLPAGELGRALDKIVQETVDLGAAPPPSELLMLENHIASHGDKEIPDDQKRSALGAPAGFACPDCNGALIEMESVRYRCQVGHAWTADALLEAQGTAWERALWTALRALDEKVRLARRMFEVAQDREAGAGVLERYRRSADEASDAAEVLRHALTTVQIREESAS